MRAPGQLSEDVRGWLRDAVARLAATYPTVHALAVSRRRTSGALDVLGIGVAQGLRDGVVLTVRDAKGQWREQVTAELSQGGVLAAVRALDGDDQRRKDIAFPTAPMQPAELRAISETELKNRLSAIQRGDGIRDGRIVYAAALIDIDDVDVWSVSPVHDRQYRARRIRERVTRAAWADTRPNVEEVERGWVGDLTDEHQLTSDEVSRASDAVLQQLTPGVPANGVAAVLLEPSVTALVVDASVQGLLTPSAARRPEVAHRIANAKPISALLSLVDDPTTPGAYGGFAFDDLGELAVPVPLIEGGRVVGGLGQGRARRPGHVGSIDVEPSHLRLTAGQTPRAGLLVEGWQLEGKVGAAYDPSSDRFVLSVARAREIKGGALTGRVYADFELVGELSTLLANVDGVARETATTVVRGDTLGEPSWRSISAPWVRTRGFVRARRGAS